MTGSRAKLANDMLAYLRKEALDRTIVFCAVKALGEDGGMSYRYAGHPHGGFAKGDAALPLAEYATSGEAIPIG